MITKFTLWVTREHKKEKKKNPKISYEECRRKKQYQIMKNQHEKNNSELERKKEVRW